MGLSKAEEFRSMRQGHRYGRVILLFLAALLAGCGQQSTPPPHMAAAPAQQAQSGGIHSFAAATSQAVPSSVQPTPAANRTDSSPDIPVYQLQMAKKDFASLERSVDSNQTYPARFTANGKTYEVKVRYRGQWARSWPKKALKILFDHDHPFEGQHALNLNSGWRDPAFVREHLAYEVYAACGVPAPKSRMVRVDLNGQFHGLYVEVEQPDKPLLRRSNLKGGALFKAISQSNSADERDLRTEAAFKRHYERSTQKEEGLADLQSFCHDLARATNLLDFFTRRLDVDEYMNYLAASVLVQHWDGFNKNHFLAFDRHGAQKWSVIPWDLDRTFGDHWNGSFDHAQLPVFLGTHQFPGVTGWSRLEDRFLSEPTLRLRFIRRLEQLLEKEFTTEKLFPRLDRLESEITSVAALDRRRWPNGTPSLHSGIAQLKSFIQRRRAYLRKELARLDDGSKPDYTLKTE